MNRLNLHTTDRNLEKQHNVELSFITGRRLFENSVPIHDRPMWSMSSLEHNEFASAFCMLQSSPIFLMKLWYFFKFNPPLTKFLLEEEQIIERKDWYEANKYRKVERSYLAERFLIRYQMIPREHRDHDVSNLTRIVDNYLKFLISTVSESHCLYALQHNKFPQMKSAEAPYTPNRNPYCIYEEQGHLLSGLTTRYESQTGNLLPKNIFNGLQVGTVEQFIMGNLFPEKYKLLGNSIEDYGQAITNRNRLTNSQYVRGTVVKKIMATKANTFVADITVIFPLRTQKGCIYPETHMTKKYPIHVFIENRCQMIYRRNHYVCERPTLKNIYDLYYNIDNLKYFQGITRPLRPEINLNLLEPGKIIHLFDVDNIRGPETAYTISAIKISYGMTRRIFPLQMKRLNESDREFLQPFMKELSQNLMFAENDINPTVRRYEKDIVKFEEAVEIYAYSLLDTIRLKTSRKERARFAIAPIIRSLNGENWWYVAVKDVYKITDLIGFLRDLLSEDIISILLEREIERHRDMKSLFKIVEENQW